MIKGCTVEGLYKICGSLISHGYKDKEILISCDDEGNGYHTLWGDVVTDVNDIREITGYGCGYDRNNPEDVILLG